MAAEHHELAGASWAPQHRFPVDASKSFFVLDREACILCGRCTTACADVQHIGAISLVGRSHDARVGVFADGAMSGSICTSCGQCVATCPTGALRPKEVAGAHRTSCRYHLPLLRRRLRHHTWRYARTAAWPCMADDAPANPSSQGMLCVKGRFGTGFVHSRDRITTPMVKRDGIWHPATWDEALDAAADGLARNAGRFGALASAKATNEDGYVIQKLARLVHGHQQRRSLHAALPLPVGGGHAGLDGLGRHVELVLDYAEAGCLMVVGADASANHPVIAVRFRQAAARGARLIVVNPKRVELCDQADLWIQERPGTDVALFNAMAKVILDEGLARLDSIAARTEGFEAWAASLAGYTLEHAEAMTGVPAEAIAQAARWYARPPFAGSCLIWGMGITQHINGTANAHCAAESLARGGADGLRRLRHLAAARAEQRAGVRRCRAASPPTCRVMPTTPRAASSASSAPGGGARRAAPGLVVTEMVEGCLDGRVRAMYVVGENPLLSEPDLHHAEKAIGQLDCLIVQDLFMHETAERAHVFLPPPPSRRRTGPSPTRSGASSASARRIPPPGEVKPDWWITCELARRVARRLGLPDDGLRLSPPERDLGRDGGAVARGRGHHLRAPRGGRAPVAVPHARAPGHPLPLRRDDFPRGRARFVPVTQTARRPTSCPMPTTRSR